MEKKINFPFEYKNFVKYKAMEFGLSMCLYRGKIGIEPPKKDFYPKAGRLNERNIWEF